MRQHPNMRFFARLFSFLAYRKKARYKAFVPQSAPLHASPNVMSPAVQKEEMPAECRKKLHGSFAKDMETLQTLVDFDVSDWQLSANFTWRGANRSVESYALFVLQYRGLECKLAS